MCMHAKLLQLYPTLYNLMDCSLPACSVHRILQTRILEWVAMRFSRRSSLHREWTFVSCGSFIARIFFSNEPPEKPPFYHSPPPPKKKIILETQNGIFDFSLTGILTIIWFDNNRNTWIWFWVCSLKECSLILPAF